MQVVEAALEASHSPFVREGLLYHGQGELLKAADYYRKAHFTDAQDADALLLLGVIARQTKQFAASVQLIARALTLRPQAAHCHVNLGLAHFAAGEMDTARSCYQCALEIDAQNAQSWCCLGDVAVQQDQEEEGFAHYEYAIAVDPQFWSARFSLGHLLCRRERYEDAAAFYREAIEIAHASQKCTSPRDR